MSMKLVNTTPFSIKFDAVLSNDLNDLLNRNNYDNVDSKPQDP